MSEDQGPMVEPDDDSDQPAEEGYDRAAEQPKIAVATTALAWLDQLQRMINEARAYLETHADPDQAEDAAAVVRSRAATFVYGRDD